MHPNHRSALELSQGAAASLSLPQASQSSSLSPQLIHMNPAFDKHIPVNGRTKLFSGKLKKNREALAVVILRNVLPTLMLFNYN